MLEPLAQIHQKTEPEKTRPSEMVFDLLIIGNPTNNNFSLQATAAQFAEKLLRSFVNYVQSFAISMPKPGSLSGQIEEYIPVKGSPIGSQTSSEVNMNKRTVHLYWIACSMFNHYPLLNKYLIIK